jgi:hypothetical protein
MSDLGRARQCLDAILRPGPTGVLQHGSQTRQPRRIGRDVTYPLGVPLEKVGSQILSLRRFGKVPARFQGALHNMTPSGAFRAAPRGTSRALGCRPDCPTVTLKTRRPPAVAVGADGLGGLPPPWSAPSHDFCPRCSMAMVTLLDSNAECAGPQSSTFVACKGSSCGSLEGHNPRSTAAADPVSRCQDLSGRS